MKEEQRLMALNTGNRRIFGLKIAEGTSTWRKLHKEELHSLCPSPSY
jgi:hypothetical protein